MGSIRLLGLFALIPTTVLLSISFFILLVLNTIKSEGLKIFGYCLAVLLWISSALVFSAGVYTLVVGHPPMQCPMYKMMKMHREEMVPEKMEGIVQEGKVPMKHKHREEPALKP
jgi:hypothetical protein